MTDNQHNQLKWFLFALLLFIAVAVMYYANRPQPIPEPQQSTFPVYSPYKNY